MDIGYKELLTLSIFCLVFGLVIGSQLTTDDKAISNLSYSNGAKCAIKYLHNKSMESGINIGKEPFVITEECRKLIEDEIKYSGGF